MIQQVGPSYGSRGHLMLQAALGQENSFNNRGHKQIKLINFRKKIRRKYVNFSDPIIKSEHVYQQTNLCDTLIDNNEDNNFTTEMPVRKPRRFKRKRDDYEVSNKRMNLDQDCLFTAPKVAKIIPYYQDNEGTLDDNLPKKDSQINKCQQVEKHLEPVIKTPLIPVNKELMQVEQITNKQEKEDKDNEKKTKLEEDKRNEEIEQTIEDIPKRSISNFLFTPAKWLMKFIYQ